MRTFHVQSNENEPCTGRPGCAVLGKVMSTCSYGMPIMNGDVSLEV